MAKQQPQKQQTAEAAQQGAAKLIAHLKGTGTGENKLAVARAAEVSGASEREGAASVYAHLEAEGIGEVTLKKAAEFIADLPEAKAAAPAKSE